MVELSTRTERHDGITLVEVTVTNDGTTPRRVRIESALDGPVWPPRRRGVPAEGWDDRTVTLSLSPGERVGLGFASPAEPVDPPVTVVGSERAAPDGGIDPSPAGVVRALGDPAPPRDVVVRDGTHHDADGAGYVPSPEEHPAGGGRNRTGPTPPGSTASDRSGVASDPGSRAGSARPADGTTTGTETSACGGSRDRRTDRPRPAASRAPGPPAVAAWLRAVEGRLENGGGADADRLRAVAVRAGRLAARAGEEP